MADFESATGNTENAENISGDRWADKQARLNVKSTRAYNRSKLDVGGKKITVAPGAIQTYEELLASQQSESSDPPPAWEVIDITSFIAKDIQKAINDIKNATDQIEAYAKLVGQAAKVVATIVSGAAAILETLINAIRDEIKALLDGFVALGGVYVLYVPPKWTEPEGGGIDYFRQTFFDSLEDAGDARRPLMSDTSSAHAIFMVAGAPSMRIFGPIMKFWDYINESEAASNAGYVTTPMPGPKGFNLEARFAPLFKKKSIDDLIQLQGDEAMKNTAEAQGLSPREIEFDQIMRRVSSYTSLTSSVAALHVFCSWELPETFEVGVFVLDGVAEAAIGSVPGIAPYGISNYFERRPNENITYLGQTHRVEAREFIKEEILLTSYVIARTTTKQELDEFSSNHPAVIKCLTEKRDLDGKAEGLGANTKLFYGLIVPAAHYLHDDDIADPTKDDVSRTFNNIPIPSNPRDATTNIYYYKMCFAGFRRKSSLKYVPTKPATAYGPEERKTYDVYKSTQAGLAAGGILNPYEATPARRGMPVEDINAIAAADVFSVVRRTATLAGLGSLSPQPIYFADEDRPVGSTKWVLSSFTGVRTVTNETVRSPAGAPYPNWYSVQLIDLLPPLKNLINEAKRFIDLIADSLIESLNGLLELVEQILAEIDYWVAWISKLMQLIRSLLIPPMAGMHVLTFETNRGIKGIKEKFERSLSIVPRTQGTLQDYPDDILRYGQKVSIGGKFVDVTTVNEGAPTSTNAASSEDAPEDVFAILGTARTELFKGKDDRGRRMNEPDDDAMKRLAVPIYDENHYCGGFVFLFEKIGIFNAFVKLLNLQELLASASNVAELQLKDQRKEYDRIKFPSLNHIASLVPDRNKELQARLKQLRTNLENRFKGDPDVGDDTKAVEDEADIAAGIDPDRIKPATGNGTLKVLTGGKEPFKFKVPSILSIIVAGIPVDVLLDQTPYSARALAAKINEAFKRKLAESLRSLLSAAEITALLSILTDLVRVADGRLLFSTPPELLGGDLPGFDTGQVPDALRTANPSEDDMGAFLASYSGLDKLLSSTRAAAIAKIKLGDGSKTLKIGTSSYPFDEVIAPGSSFAGLKLPNEVNTLEGVVALKKGDLIVEVEEFGIPTLEQFRRSPAVYEFNDFVDNPDIQDFAPDRKNLMITVDDLGEQVVDVTGNGGTNPIDAGPSVLLQKSGGDPFTFPIVVDGGSNKFKVEIDGSFILLADIPNVSITNFKIVTVEDDPIDFVAARVRSGDVIHIKYADDSIWTAKIELVTENQLTIDASFTFDVAEGSAQIDKIVRGTLPSALENDDNPTFSALCAFKVDADERAVLTLNNLTDLKQNFEAAFSAAGLNEGTVSMDIIDESPESDGTVGRIRMYLDTRWGRGTDTKLKIAPPDTIGSAAGILTGVISSAFPLEVDASKTSFRLEFFGPGADDSNPSGFVAIGIGTGTYPSVASLANAMQASLETAGYDDVKIGHQGGRLKFYVDASGPTHFAYSDRVGIRVKAMPTLGPLALPESFGDGVSVPPSLEVNGLVFPFVVAPSYGDFFAFEIDPPLFDSVPSGGFEVRIPTGTYADATELAEAVATGLSLAGVGSSSKTSGNEAKSALVRVRGAGDTLTFSLKPEAAWLGPEAAIAIGSGRASPVALTGPTITWGEMRDYAYERVFAWYTANPAVQPGPGFPVPAPLAFFASDYGATGGPTVYDGTWELVSGVNDTFQMMIDTPVPGFAVGWQVISLPATTYADFAALRDAVQTAVDAVFGAGVVDVSDVGLDQLQFEIIDADLFGEFTTLRTRPDTGKPFASMGAQTGGAITAAQNGTGDVRFLEMFGAADAAAIGSDDLFTHLDIMDGASDFDEFGLPFLEARGVNDDNLLRILGINAFTAFGTYKIVYELEEIVAAINAHFAGVSADYARMASIGLTGTKLRLRGKIASRAGKMNIRVFDQEDIDAGTRESSEVGTLLFGYLRERQEDVDIRGIGRAPTAQLCVVTIDDRPDMDMVLLGYDEHEVVLEDVDAHVVELEDTLDLIVDVERLDIVAG